MKTRFKTIAIILCTTLIFTACVGNLFNGVSGNGNVVVAQRPITADFTTIKSSNGLEIILTQGNTLKITVEADENLHDLIKTEIDNNTLRIYSEKNIGNAKARKVHVVVTKLTEIEASSGSFVSTTDVFNTTDINVKASSGARINADLEASSVYTNASSGANISLSGTTNNHSSSASSGSSINTNSLKSKTANANVSSGASIRIYASEQIEASASSGGSINAKGNAKVLSKSESSGGSFSNN